MVHEQSNLFLVLAYSPISSCNLTLSSHVVYGVSELEQCCHLSLDITNTRMMSVDEPGTSVASCFTDPLSYSPWIREEEEQVQGDRGEREMNGKMEVESLRRDSSDDDLEPEPPPTVRRKVSFADAFGLNLVSVKEFDSGGVSETGGENSVLGGEERENEEYYLRCLFSVPASPEELEVRLQHQQLELESIELLPGTSTIRGIIRVVNLCFHKTIYVRTSLDKWKSHFDLLAEFVPGSSDGATDRFAFQLMIQPPFGPEGARIEFCLCYETSSGTFWANNSNMNYVLFCHQKGGRELRERDKDRDIEESNQRGKRSCLKAIRIRNSVEAKPAETSRENTVCREFERRSDHDIEKEAREPLVDHHQMALVDSRRRRSAARVKDFTKMDTEAHMGTIYKQGKNDRSANVTGSASEMGLFRGYSRRKQRAETPQVALMHHQFPLLPLDWSRESLDPVHPHTPDTCSGINPEGQAEDSVPQDSVDTTTLAWEAFLNGPVSTDKFTDIQVQSNPFPTSPASPVAQSELTHEIPAPDDNDKVHDVKEPDTNTYQSNLVGKAEQWPNLAMVTSESWSVSDIPDLSAAQLNPDTDRNDARVENLELSDQGPQKIRVRFVTHTLQELEPMRAERRSEVCGDSVDSHTKHTHNSDMAQTWRRSCRGRMTEDGTDTKPSNSHVEDGILARECEDSVISTNTGTEGEEHGHRAAPDESLTFSEISLLPEQGKADAQTETESEGSLERQDKEGDRMSKGEKENMREEREDVTPVERGDFNSEECEIRAGRLEGTQQTDDEISVGKKEGNCDAEIYEVPKKESVAFVEEKSHLEGESLHTGSLELPPIDNVSQEQENKGPIEETENRIEGVTHFKTSHSSVTDLAQKMLLELEQHNTKQIFCSIAVGQKSLVGEREGGRSLALTNSHTDEKSPNMKEHRTSLAYHHTLVQNTACDGKEPSCHSGQTSSTIQDLTMLQHGPIDEVVIFGTRRHNPQVLEEDGEIGMLFPKDSAAVMGSVASGLLGCWREFCSRVLFCIILFVVFLTVYLCEMPACLTIYLMSVCWWCGQEEKQRVPGTEGVD